MAYGLKYRNNFEGINDLTNVKYNVLLEIFQDGYAGAVTEIEEMDKNPLQFRLDNSGDTHYVPIKKTSVSINIVDTGQFDYSEFYTSNAKMYKVVITSPVLNWQGYLVPQSYNSNLNYRQPFTLTASDGLHLLSSIDYVPDQSKTVSLSAFIADVESKIGLGTFDKTTTIQTEIGNVWDALIYEGMFTDLNYEEALEMVLKSIGMQLRYWKIFPIIESYNVTNNADIQIINKDITLDFLAPIKTAKVTQNITTLPDLMLNGMVDDLSDLAESNVGHVLPFDTLSKWVADPTAGGVIVNRGRTRSTSDRDTSDYFTSINLELMPVNGVKESFELTGNEISYFVCRPVYATPLTFSIKANFGKIAYFSGRGSASGLVNSKLYPSKYTELKYGIYDEISNKSFNYSTMAWDITGRPTQANCNKLRITDPKDGDTTIYIETPVTSGGTSKINFYLLGGSVEYADAMLPAVAQTMVKNILSIDAIEVDGVSLVSDKELYNEISSVVDVAPNIDVLDCEVDFGYCPSPPANTSLYYGSAFYHTNLAQILNVVVQGNTIPWLQYIYQTLLYTQNVQRKKVYTCSLLLKSVVNPIWLRTTLMGDVVMTNSLNFDWKTSQISAELTEIQPYVYSAWNIASESKIGSSDWGGSGGTSGSVGGSSGTVDLSNCVVKTGATSQDIEGDISANNMVSRGAVVAGALNGTLPDDLPVSSPLLYGVSKYDDVTIKINSNGQWYVATSGGTVVSFGTEVAGQSIQLIVAAITKTLALAGHTHSQYLTAITKAMVEAVLTGDITSHTHSQYLLATAYTASDVLAKLLTVDGSGSGLDADLLDSLHGSAYMRYLGWVDNPGYNANTMAGNTTGFTYANNTPYVGPIINIDAGGYNLEINAQYNNDSLIAYRVKNADSGTWNTWSSFYNSANANLKTVDWNAKDLKCVNTFADGAVVAGALNGTLPDDLPVATSSLFGVVKFDPTTLALNGSNQLTVIGGGGGSDVAWGTPTAQYTPLTVDSVTRNLSLDGHTHSYLPLSGGMLTGDLYLGTQSIDRTISVRNVTGPENGQLNLNPWGGLVTANGYKVWHAGNDGTGSGLDADLLDGFHAIPGGSAWNKIPIVASDGVIEIGKCIDFHSINNDGLDYSTRLQAFGISGNVLSLPTTSGTLAMLTDNVASATKLANTRTIWGQNFNGEVNVTGAFMLDGLQNSQLSIYSNGNSREIQSYNGYLSLNPGGNNVLIGTRTNSIYLLDVNGTFRSVGAAYLNSTLAVTSTSTFTGLLTANGGISSTIGTFSSTVSATALTTTGYWNDSLFVENLTDHIHHKFNGVHTVSFGGTDEDYAHRSYIFRPAASTKGATSTFLYIQNASADSTPVYTTTHSFDGSGNATHTGYLTASRFYTGYDAGLANSFSCSNWFRSNGASGWYNATYTAGILSDTANVVRTYSTNKFKVYNTAIDSILTLGGVTAANVVSSGAVVAGALNGTLPDDMPIATTSLFGVSKYSGLAVQPTAGDVALRTKHYTSPTVNTWYNKAYTITYEIGFSSPGSLSAGAYYSSLYLYSLPTAKCLACNITVIPYATGTTPPWIGQQLIASAAKDSTGYWRVFIYNPTGSSVDLTNVKLSIIAQMIE